MALNTHYGLKLARVNLLTRNISAGMLGYLEKDSNTYFFASAVFGKNMPQIQKARLNIAEEVLREPSTSSALTINMPE